MKKDLCDFGIKQYSFQQISVLKKYKWKNIIKEACKNAAFKYLIQETKDNMGNTKTKSLDLKYETLKLQKYLKDERLSLSEKQLAFKIRNRMLEVNHNFGRKIQCPLCLSNDDNQKHLMDCVIIKISSKKLFHNKKSKYEDIFGYNVRKIGDIVKIIEDALKSREVLLDK